ncbi:MAG: ABC transporter substrate-binding protein [Micromonosporaceae bacterium]|nr:ABC transporter substrate-binding protein [Micromonosporaceae bacterium]
MQARRLKAAVAVAAAVTLAVTGCAESKRGGEKSAKSTLVFGAAGAPETFDPTFATDGETFRVARQMYETLLDHKPGTAELSPGLAESWEPNDDGTAWTFKLRENVKFHDGTDFNAEAVCFNYDRWHNLDTEAAQAQAIYYLDVFGGFKSNKGEYGETPYVGCEATDTHTAVIKLKEFQGKFPAAFSLTSLSISSPTAMQKYDADNVVQEGETFAYPDYATKHPTGTGPFKFVKYDEANETATLERFDGYWGGKAKLKKLLFKTIPDENARKQELQAGTIDGYDLPSPADYQTLKDEGFKLEIRDAFNVLYLGINQRGPAKELSDIRVRKAIAHAMNREQLVKTKLPEGASVATQFMPDSVLGYADDVEKYDYDLDKAKALLKEAGAENLKVKFYYPTEVTRPYMPNPKEIFQVLSDDLAKAGIEVEPVAKPWTEYLDAISQTRKHDLHLLGWTGDFNDPINWNGTFFGRGQKGFGTEGMKDMFAAIAKADSIVDQAEKESAWQEVNRRLLSEWLPAVPVSHSPPGIVVKGNIKGLVASPLTAEKFNTVYFS